LAAEDGVRPREDEEMPEEVGEEQQTVKVPKAPDTPTLRDIEEHEAAGHVAHRSWCMHCARARAMESQHRAAPPEAENAVPTIMIDYMFMGQDDEKSAPMLAIKNRKTKQVWCSVVPAKGVDPFAVRFLADAVRETGYRRIIFKSDNEPSIIALKAAVREAVAEVEFVLNESPTGDHRANGEIEVMIRELKRQIRVLKSDTEERLKKALGDDHPVLAWLPRHAAFLLTRFRVGEDGKRR
jgi:hypothetical protein